MKVFIIATYWIRRVYRLEEMMYPESIAAPSAEYVFLLLINITSKSHGSVCISPYVNYLKMYLATILIL